MMFVVDHADVIEQPPARISSPKNQATMILVRTYVIVAAYLSSWLKLRRLLSYHRIHKYYDEGAVEDPMEYEAPISACRLDLSLTNSGGSAPRPRQGKDKAPD
jgi:hypothetical protein